MTVRTKITLWLSALIILITAVMFSVILLISRSALYTDVKQTLTDIVSGNTQEIEFHETLDDSEMETGDQFIEYNGGYLEIDDDFLNESMGVKSALYDSEGNLLYGENFISAEVGTDETIQKVPYGKENYYVINIALNGDGLDGLVLQGTINEDADRTVLTTIATLSLLILPLLALVAIIGCYFLAGRFLRPIRDITRSAEEISDGNDLSKRIELGKSKDELYVLGDTFNKMFERLERSFEEEKQFTSDISHELRTPVATIMAQSELTLEKERTTWEYIKSLTVIKRQSARMKSIVEEMLRFSRLERLQCIPDESVVDLSTLLNDIVNERKLTAVRGIKLDSDIEDNIKISGSSDMLEAMVNNLISNAYRYGKDDGSIFVSLKKDGKKIVLSVKDDGIGIEKDLQDKIFNRFYRADDSRSYGDSKYGLGLGLPMASQIAMLHGGKITLESEVGKGSIFSFVKEI